MKNKKTTRFLALALSALLLPAAPFTASAEDAVVKDFAYYSSLDDYQVYVEFCEVFQNMDGGSDIVIEDAIPENTEDMPAYANFESSYLEYQYYGTTPCFVMQLKENYEEAYAYYDDLFLYGTEEDALHSIEILGFEGKVTDPAMYVWLEECGQEAMVYVESSILYEPGTMDMIDFYRLYLAIYNGEFFQIYGEQLHMACYDGPASYILGDADMNFGVNATDAALILHFAALCGCGTVPDPAEYGINEALADINEDGLLDAQDAREILAIAAEEGV